MASRRSVLIDPGYEPEAARHVRRLACSLGVLGCFALGCNAEDARAPPPPGNSDPSNHEPLPEASTPREASMSDQGFADVGVDMSTSIDGSSCEAAIEQRAITGGAHLPECTYIEYATNPPSSGDHYPAWVAHKTYDVPIPRGFLVHNLEHAGTVIWYNCPNGCPGEVAAAQEFIDGLPIDPLCPTPGPKRRVLMAPDPWLDTKWAASVWGWTLRAACFDKVAFARFLSERYGQGPENFCSDGIDLVDVDGSLRLPPGCGRPSDAAAPVE
jgi:uncharacterized protein DUF3105